MLKGPDPLTDGQLGLLLDAQRRLERNVFRTPPSSWDQFNQLLGEWKGLDKLIEADKAAREAQEHEDD